jgi:hypothetical protein
MEMEPNKMLLNFKEELTSFTSFISFMIPIFEGRIQFLIMETFGFLMQQDQKFT